MFSLRSDFFLFTAKYKNNFVENLKSTKFVACESSCYNYRSIFACFFLDFVLILGQEECSKEIQGHLH